MAVFTYKALDAPGKGSLTGTIIADTARAARDQLRARGLTIECIDETNPSKPAKGSTKTKAKPPLFRFTGVSSAAVTTLLAILDELELHD